MYNGDQIKRSIESVERAFVGGFPNLILSEGFKSGSLSNFAAQINEATLVSFMKKAVLRVRTDPEGAIKFFCACCWNNLRGPTFTPKPQTPEKSQRKTLTTMDDILADSPL